MEEVLAEHGHSVSECGVISAEYLQEQSYRAETQRAEAMKEKLAAEKPAPEASISFYVAEYAEFPVMGEFHDNLTLEQALEVYDKIPAERMNGIPLVLSCWTSCYPRLMAMVYVRSFAKSRKFRLLCLLRSRTKKTN